MSSNRSKISQQNVTGKASIFEVLERNLKLDGWFESGVPTKYFLHILFVTFLGLVYIWNTHYADRMSRKTTTLKKDVEDLRADYTTLKADYMFESKQSEVAKKVKGLGLEEGGKAPKKIVLKSNDGR